MDSYFQIFASMDLIFNHGLYRKRNLFNGIIFVVLIFWGYWVFWALGLNNYRHNYSFHQYFNPDFVEDDHCGFWYLMPICLIVLIPCYGCGTLPINRLHFLFIDDFFKMKSLISLRFWVDCLIIKVWVLIIEFFLTLRWLSLRREGNEMCNRTSQKDWSTLTSRSTLRKRVGFLHTFGRVIHYVQVERTERCASVKGTPFLEGVSTLYEMCIIVLLVNVLGWSPVYYSTISIARF
jgi:hypothetical protein